MGDDCDQLLRNQLVLTRGASTAARMNDVIRYIQNQRQACAPELWNPMVDDSTAGVVADTDACFAANAAGNTNSVGNVLVPAGLRDGNIITGAVRVISGRDTDNNIIVYWALAGNRPTDNALCWLFVRRLNTWTSNHPRTGTAEKPESVLKQPLEGQELEEKSWYHLQDEDLGINAVVMAETGGTIFTMYGCNSRISVGDDQTPLVYITYTQIEIPITDKVAKLVRTTVNGNELGVIWQQAPEDEHSMRLLWGQALTLIQTLTESGADHYTISHEIIEELNKELQTKELKEALEEAGITCLFEQPETELERPKSPQTPVNGFYEYTTPDGRFRLQYPTGCGQLWEGANRATNFDTCGSWRTQIGTHVETWDHRTLRETARSNPASKAKEEIELLAEREPNSDIIVATTNQGETIHVAVTPNSRFEGITNVVGFYIDSEWRAIEIAMYYFTEEGTNSIPRIREALESLEVANPLQ